MRDSWYFLRRSARRALGLVAAGEALLGDLGFAGGDERDAFLVLAQFVALVFEVEDCSIGNTG